nr:MAG TPA: hypothetical protein [Caudoviricetes sp.]
MVSLPIIMYVFSSFTKHSYMDLLLTVGVM